VKQGASETIPARPPKLLDQMRIRIRAKHYSLRTERAYFYWARWYLRFHGLRHPKEMGGPEIQAFMSSLISDHNFSGSVHTQALCALSFLYKSVLEIDLPWIEGIHRPMRPPKRVVVLTSQEVNLVFAQMAGVHKLIAQMLHGTSMCLSECAGLRIKDVDFQRREITTR
jgi:integrase